MSARDAQPFGLVEVAAGDLRPFDRVLKDGRPRELVSVTRRLLDPSPWQTEDDDGYRLALEWLDGAGGPMVRPTVRYLLCVPVQRA